MRDWLEENETDPGYEAFTTEQIAAQVAEEEKEDRSDDEEEIQVKKIKLSILRTYIDALINYTEYSKIEEANAYYGGLRMLDLSCFSLIKSHFRERRRGKPKQPNLPLNQPKST